jgi:hypothetical protein
MLSPWSPIRHIDSPAEKVRDIACAAISLRAFSSSELNNTHFSSALWPRSFAAPFAMAVNSVFAELLLSACLEF